MSSLVLCDEYKDLLNKAHQLEEELLSLDTDMETHEVRVLRERIIDVTLRLDEIRAKMGREIKVHY